MSWKIPGCLVMCLFLVGCASAPVSPPAHPAPPPPPRPPKVGLVLGGGGARGFAEIGVLRVLEQEKIPIHLVVGTSVGSLIGALYADTANVLDVEFEAVQLTEDDIFDKSLLSFLSGGFVKGERLERFLEQRLKHQTIETLRVPFAAVATDLRTGETVVFDRGSVAKAVHASAAIPGVFVPVIHEGRTLVDGGVTNPIPVDVARKLGAEVVIAVAIPADVPAEAPRAPVQIALHASTLMAAEIGWCRAKEAEVLIRPEVGPVAYDDFTQKKRLIDAGAAAARAALPQIHRVIAGVKERS